MSKKTTSAWALTLGVVAATAWTAASLHATPADVHYSVLSQADTTTKPDTTKPDTTKPKSFALVMADSTPKDTTTKPDTTKPDTTKPKSFAMVMADSTPQTTPKDTVTKPDTTKPDTTKKPHASK